MIIKLWAAGDTADQHHYAFQNSIFDDCYIVGSKPSPWFADVSIGPDAIGDSIQPCNSVAAGAGGRVLTHVPASRKAT